MTLICTFPCVFIIVSSSALNPGKEKPCSPSSCVPVLQGWRSPGFLVSRASSYSSSSSCNSSDVSPSSSAPSVDSGGSSPLPGERPPCPRDHQSHTHKTQPQTARWLVHAFVLSIGGSCWYLWSEAGRQLYDGASRLTSIGAPLPVSAVQKQNRFSLTVVSFTSYDIEKRNVFTW